MSTPPPATTPWVPMWNLNGAAGMQYRGAYTPATQYADGDIVVYNGVSYMCVRPTVNPPAGWPNLPYPPVVNGQWLKGSGGAAVWAAINPADISPVAWATYTPAWACSSVAPALGNGTCTARYQTLGKTVMTYGSWTAGTTTTYGSGTFAFSLPPGLTGAGYQSTLGNAWGWRGGVGTFPIWIPRISPNGQYVEFLQGGATWPTGLLQVAGSTPPWGGAWANGDSITWAYLYEAA